MTSSDPALRLAVPDAIDPAVLASFNPHAPVVRLGGDTMGTSWQVAAALPAACGLTAAKLRTMVQARLDGIVQDMSHWDADSNLSRFNHAGAGSVLALSPDFARVMATALTIAEASDGAFDPAIGRLTDLWGLGPRPADQRPDDALVRQSLSPGGWHKLRFDPQHSTLRQPGGLWLDLSGIAKGFTVDAIADLLAAHGVFHGLIEIGGECVGRGLRPDGDPWWVDIENPPGTALPLLRIALHQLAVASSGDYLRGAHTLDPRTGHPAIHTTTSVTVLHTSCMHADAWATALGVVEAPAARQLARDHQLAARIVGRDGSEWLSPSLAAMIEEDLGTDGA